MGNEGRDGKMKTCGRIMAGSAYAEKNACSATVSSRVILRESLRALWGTPATSQAYAKEALISDMMRLEPLSLVVCFYFAGQVEEPSPNRIKKSNTNTTKTARINGFVTERRGCEYRKPGMSTPQGQELRL